MEPWPRVVNNSPSPSYQEKNISSIYFRLQNQQVLGRCQGGKCKFAGQICWANSIAQMLLQKKMTFEDFQVKISSSWQSMMNTNFLNKYEMSPVQ